MSGKRERRRRGCLSRLLWLTLLLAALAAFCIYENRSLQATETEVLSARLPEDFDGFRAVQLSDLHGAEFGRGNRRLLDAVRQAEPEAIFLTGDLVDRHTAQPERYAAELGAALTAVAPTYYVTGNHEWSLGTAAVKRIKEALRQSGVTVLSNDFVTLSRGGAEIALAGVDDPNGYADQKTPEALAEELRQSRGDGFWLLLAHRNNRFRGGYCCLGADLTLSGHAHGGIWRLPFTDGLIDTTMTLFPSYTSGLYRCDAGDCGGAQVYVSRGLGNSPRFALRLLNRPEVSVLTFRRAA